MKKQQAFMGILYFAIIASLVIIFSIIRPFEKKVDASDGCGSSFAQPNSVLNGCGLVIKEGMAQAEINYETEFMQGAVSWILKDPNGKVIWESGAEGTMSGNHTLANPQPGRYFLEITTKQAQGSYMFWIK